MTGQSTSEYADRIAKQMSEAQLQACIIGAAQRLNWLVYHTHDSRRSQPGFPDLVLVRGRRILYRELKTQTGRLRPEQHAWLHRLEDAGADAAIWRPADWMHNRVLDDLMDERR